MHTGVAACHYPIDLFGVVEQDVPEIGRDEEVLAGWEPGVLLRVEILLAQAEFRVAPVHRDSARLQ